MEIIDSVKMKGDDEFVRRCNCLKEYPVLMSEPLEGSEIGCEWQRIKEGDSYNYTFDDGKYYIRTYSPDFVPGKNGKIVEQGSCSTLILTPEEFREHFKI